MSQHRSKRPAHRKPDVTTITLTALADLLVGLLLLIVDKLTQ